MRQWLEDEKEQALKRGGTQYAAAYVEGLKDGYNKGLEEAAENAVAKENPADYGTGEIWVDKKSILDLKIK